MFLQLNFINSIKYLWRTEGFKGLFKGIVYKNISIGNFVNCIRVAPFTACEFAFYDLFKRILLKDNYPKKGFYMKRFLSGAMTGLIATTVVIINGHIYFRFRPTLWMYCGLSYPFILPHMQPQDLELQICL